MDLIMYTLRSISSAIIAPPLVFILIILMLRFYFMNKKTESIQSMIVGGKGESALELTLSQFVFGIMGGTFGSIILAYFRVRFDYYSGIQYLFFISILLFFIKPKYICFSYSAGILGIISILIETLSGVLPKTINKEVFEVNIIYLLLFVGTLHIVEGILVMLDGSKGAIPIFKEYENNIVGGYSLKRNWLMPIAMIFTNMVSGIENSVELSANIPYWCETISGSGLIVVGAIAMMPLYAVIGYSNMTFTKSKKKKALVSGIHIFIYGICVVIISQIAKFGVAGKLFAVIFVPTAHEFVLRIQRKSEETNEPMFVSDENGLVVLDISRDSQMNQYDIEIGDKILSVNENKISSEREVYQILKKSLYKVNIRISKKTGEIKEFMHVHDKTRRLGILLVPRKVLKEEITEVKGSSFETILEEIKRVKDSTNNN